MNGETPDPTVSKPLAQAVADLIALDEIGSEVRATMTDLDALMARLDGALVIERDENGEWPEWAITAVAVRLIKGHHLRHFPPFGEYALACEALDALAAGEETDNE